MLVLVQCQAIQQTRNFANCEFSLVAMNRLSMAGIDILGIQKLSDLGLPAILQLGTLFINESEFPLDINLSVEVRNPNNVLAAMNRLEYICLIDDREVLSGVMKERVEVPPLGKATFPIDLRIDLKKIFKDQESRNAVIGFGLGLVGNSQQPSRLSIKAKPSIRIGKRYVKYPGYIKFKDNLNLNR
ncbi:MAG: LEA type 2 family protein [Bacteroidia bacterium]|nr:LEA type 2 family protein [Bacteroidia bacterium]